MPQRTPAVALALGDAVGRLHAVVRRDLSRAGVRLATARTLATLEREGPQRLTELAAIEQVTQPSMSALVARLEAQGLVRRSGDDGDGRLVIVSITPAGTDLVGSILERRGRLLAAHLDRLDPADRAAIEAALPALANLIDLLEDRSRLVTSR